MHFLQYICIITEAFITQSKLTCGSSTVIGLLIDTYNLFILGHTQMSKHQFFAKYKAKHLLDVFPPVGYNNPPNAPPPAQQQPAAVTTAALTVSPLHTHKIPFACTVHINVEQRRCKLGSN